jgi:predicted DNA-binding transcriptional regulator YafY
MVKNKKINRQLIILGLCMANNSKNIYTAFDFAEMFKVSEITIQRDISELRKSGIPILQSKNGGLEVVKNNDTGMLRKLLLQIIGNAYSSAIFDRAVNYFTDNTEYTENFIQVLIGINTKKKINCCIEGYGDKIDISPLKIFQNESDWNLLAATNYDGLKHFAINELTNVKVLEYDSVIFPDEKIEAYIRENIYSNFKKGNVAIKLQFAKPDLDGHFPMKHCKYVLTKNHVDGTAIVTAEVSSLDDVVNWLIKNTPKVKILEPPELVTKLLEKIEGIKRMTKDIKNDYIPNAVYLRNLRFQKSCLSEEFSDIDKLKYYNNVFNDDDFSVFAEIRI